MRGIHKRLLLVMIFFFTIFYGVIFISYLGFTDLFLFEDIAFSEFISNTLHHIPRYDPFARAYVSSPGVFYILIVLSKIPGISLQNLQFFPVQGFILPTIYYVFARKLGNFTKYAVISTVIMMFGLSNQNFYGVWGHGWAYLIYLIFLWVIWDIMSGGLVSVQRIILLLILIISTSTYSYQVNLWETSVLVFISGVYLSVVRFKSTNTLNKGNDSWMYIGVALSAMLLLGKPMIYYDFLGNLKLFGIELFTSFGAFFTRYFQKQLTTQYNYSLNPWVSRVYIIYLLLLWIPILYYFIVSFKFKKRDNTNFSAFQIFVGGVIFADVVFLLVYSLYGFPFFIHELFIFPALSLAIFHRISFQVSVQEIRKNFVNIIVVSLIIISFLRPVFLIEYSDPVHDLNHYAEQKIGGKWFLTHYSSDNPVIMDLRTEYITLLSGVSTLELSQIKRLQNNVKILDESIYKKLTEVDNNECDMLRGYAMIPTYAKLEGKYWRYYVPYYRYRYQIRALPCKYIIYSSTKLSILYLP